MNETEGRLWGIDLIAAIYALATLLLIWLYDSGTPMIRTFILVLTPVAAEQRTAGRIAADAVSVGHNSDDASVPQTFRRARRVSTSATSRQC